MSTSIAFAHDLFSIRFTSSAFPTSRAGRLASSEDLYRFLSHSRMLFSSLVRIIQLLPFRIALYT